MKRTFPIRFSLVLGAALLLGLLLLLPQQSGEGEAYAEDEVQAEGAKKPSAAQGQQTLESQAMTVLETYCVSCHGAEQQKGDVRFDTIETLDPVTLQALFGNMKAVVDFEEMPPAKAKQPTETEREILARWVDRKISPTEKRKLADKLKKPEFGNYVDHDDLFSGEYADLPAYTTDRRWLISEFIFDAKMQRITENRTVANWQDKRVEVLGGHNISGLSLANPFLLPEKSGVRYYAIEDLTGGHLSTMLSNAQKTSIYITENLIKNGRNKKYLPVTREVLALEDQHEATLLARRAFLEKHIARVCEDIYGEKNAELLPEFVPVQLNEIKELEEGEKYKRLGVQIAVKNLTKLGGSEAFFRIAMDPDNADKSDQEIAELCERTWFNDGDYERDIQGRMSILREYTADFRKDLDKYGRKHKPAAYKPLDEAEMAVIHASIRKHRAKGDRYNQVLDKCLADWERQFKQDRIDAGPPSDELYGRLIDELFMQVLERSPESNEAEEYRALVKGYTEKLGRRKAVQKLIQTLLLTSEFAYRSEYGAGEADAHGRRMMPPRDAAYAIAYALTDQSPDEALLAAAEAGRLNTREDYKREVTRLLAQRDRYYQVDKKLADKWREGNVTNMPIRELRFWREFFGYPKALTIFKDEKRFGARRLGKATSRLLEEADRMVAHILEEDQDVFEQLLTTEQFIVYHDGDTERMRARSDEIERIYEYFKDKDWQDFTMEDLTDTHADFLRTVDMRTVDPDKPEARTRQGNMLQLFKKSMRSIIDRLDDGQEHAAPFDLYIGYGNDFMPGMYVGKFWNYELSNWHWEPVQPAKVPNRKGMLTHPAWLIAHAFNTENDPVHRGKWVREKLLAGTIPDVPITVDAQIPEDHNKTLRQRLAMATENDYCWRCHVDMNPLGNAFEMYDDFGRFRTEEALEYPGKMIEEGPEIPYGNQGSHLVDYRDIYETLPVDSTGALTGTGDSSLEGPVKDAIELADRLGRSERVRQSIVRHAFRYFMGRNETLNDSKTLIDADRAYVESGGSFDALVISLLTSDSFIYRKPIED